jgi:ankyrin repeat protein
MSLEKFKNDIYFPQMLAARERLKHLPLADYQQAIKLEFKNLKLLHESSPEITGYLDVQIKELEEYPDEQVRDSALIFAATKDSVDGCKESVILGANLSALSHSERLPLMIAASRGSSLLFEELVRLGADIHQLDEEYQLPIRAHALVGMARYLHNKEQKIVTTGSFHEYNHILQILEELNPEDCSYAAPAPYILSAIEPQAAGLKLIEAVKGHDQLNTEQVMQCLLSNADLEVRNEKAENAIGVAASYGNIAFIKKWQAYEKQILGKLKLDQQGYQTEYSVSFNLQTAEEVKTANDQLESAIKAPDWLKCQRLLYAGADPNLLLNIVDRTTQNLANQVKTDCDQFFLLAKNPQGDFSEFTRLLQSQRPGLLGPGGTRAGFNLNILNEIGQTPLIVAAVSGNLAAVRYLIAAGADLSACDPAGKNALAYAIENNQVDVIGSFIAAGMDVNLLDKTGKTAIMHAAYAQKLEATNMLIAAGADVNAVDKDGRAVIVYSCGVGYAPGPVGELLLNSGANITPLAKYLAAWSAAWLLRKAGPTVAQKIIEAMTGLPLIGGVAKIAGGLVGTVDGVIANLEANGLTPAEGLKNIRELHMRNQAFCETMCKGTPAAVESAIKNGAIIHICDRHGKTPLMAAAELGKVDNIIRLFFYKKNEMNVNLVDDQNKTAVMYAAGAGQMESVEFLLKHKADLNKVDLNGKTAFDYAFKAGHLEICKALLMVADQKLEFNLNNVDKNGKTFLHHMMEGNDNDRYIDKLFELGAGVNIKDKNKHQVIFSDKNDATRETALMDQATQLVQDVGVLAKRMVGRENPDKDVLAEEIQAIVVAKFGKAYASAEITKRFKKNVNDLYSVLYLDAKKQSEMTWFRKMINVICATFGSKSPESIAIKVAEDKLVLTLLKEDRQQHMATIISGHSVHLTGLRLLTPASHGAAASALPAALAVNEGEEPIPTR